MSKGIGLAKWIEALTALLTTVRKSIMRIIHLVSKKVILTTPSWIVNNSASRTIAYYANVLDNDTCSSSLQK